MTIEQTIEIPASRRIFLDLPPELPVGKAKVEVIVTPDLGEQSSKPSRGPHIPVVFWFQKRREEKFRRAIMRVAGKFAHVFDEDGVVIQRGWRDEWDSTDG